MTVSKQHIVLLTMSMMLELSSMAQLEVDLSEGFLEYLATMVEDDGEWVDPMMLEDDEIDVAEVRAVKNTVNDETHTAEETR